MLGILATILYRVDVTTQPLLSYGGIYGGMSALLSFVSNLIATVLIGQKAWYAGIGVDCHLTANDIPGREHRKFLRQSPGASKGRWNTPTMKVLTLLVESGTMYSVLFVGILDSRFQR